MENEEQQENINKVQANMSANLPEAQAQAQADSSDADSGDDVLGYGLNKKYGIHPHHIKEGKNKYVFSSKAKKHIKNLEKLLPPHHVESIITWSLLNKARNDKQELAKKFKSKTPAGYKKEKVAGGAIFHKL